MRLYYVGDDKREIELDGVIVGLTKEEAYDLAHAAMRIATGEESFHIHVSSADYQREVTVYPLPE